MLFFLCVFYIAFKTFTDYVIVEENEFTVRKYFSYKHYSFYDIVKVKEHRYRRRRTYKLYAQLNCKTKNIYEFSNWHKNHDIFLELLKSKNINIE